MSRTFLSSTSDWELVHDGQDLRGLTALDAAGAPVGVVESMIVDTDAEIVSSIVLDTGAEIPAFDVTIGDGVVYLAGAIPGAATAPQTPVDPRHRVIRRMAVPVPDPVRHAADFQAHHAARTEAAGQSYDAVEAAYRYGYEAAHAEGLRNRTYADAEPDLRAAYPSDRNFETDREAVQYAFRRAQRRQE